jgi:hypothetical protein
VGLGVVNVFFFRLHNSLPCLEGKPGVQKGGMGTHPQKVKGK